MFTILDQPLQEGRFIDVVAVIFADFAKGLNADGQFFMGHGGVLMALIGGRYWGDVQGTILRLLSRLVAMRPEVFRLEN